MRFKLRFFVAILVLFLFVLVFSFLFCFLSGKDSERFYFTYVQAWSESFDQFISEEFQLTHSKCFGNFNIYKNKFVVLKNVFLDKTKAFGLSGGESLLNVLNQSEKSEFLRYDLGFLSIPCFDVYKEKIDFLLGDLNHFNHYYSSLTYFSPRLLDYFSPDRIYRKKVLFITRNEYANFYHTMTDFYITFLICRIFHWSVQDIHVVLTDGHPQSLLDDVWYHLFPTLSRFSNFSIGNKLLIGDLIWIPFGYIAPIMQLSWPSAPLLGEFREFFLSSYSINPFQSRNKACEPISILFIWRRDYLSHPRNPSGEISRKIANERELVTALQAATKTDPFLSRFNIVVSEAQFDRYSMQQQLEIISNTSILIAMHGAALTHTLFLPDGAGLVELFPLYYGDKNVHFKSICKWRGLHYEFYANKSPKMEIGKYLTYFKPVVVIDRVKNIIKRFQCNF